MKKMVLAVLLVLLVFLLTGCGDDRLTYYGNTNLNDHKLMEWVSPDGVHYWFTYYCLAPRYNSDGMLVIEPQEETNEK